MLLLVLVPLLLAVLLLAVVVLLASHREQARGSLLLATDHPKPLQTIQRQSTLTASRCKRSTSRSKHFKNAKHSCCNHFKSNQHFKSKQTL